jgi:hypothetical protein
MASPKRVATREEEHAARLVDCPERHCVGKTGIPCRTPNGKPREAHAKRLKSAVAAGVDVSRVVVPEPLEHDSPAVSEPRNGWRDRGSQTRFSRSVFHRRDQDWGPFDD